ncbi:hypothetical protein AALB39_24070 [Lachnospiraceae bacterium 54-53]
MEQAIFKDYSVIEGLLKDTVIPDMFKVRQTFSRERIEDVAEETRRQLTSGGLEEPIQPGMTIAVTGSSRGIANMNIILRETVRFLKEAGALPFIIPAMGSHGGATAEGQKAVLAGYGITEEFCGCPIVSSMDTVCIGLGKQKGADCMHNDGFKYFKTRIPLFGNYVRTHTNVHFAVASIENAYDETSKIAVLRNEEIPVKEPELLKYAFSLMPRILVDETDVLIVNEIGKNFSGSGMDPNITGTWSTPYGSGGIKKQRTVVLDLSDESHGNGLGIGQADTTTLRFFNKMDFTETYPNALTSTVSLPVKLAMVLKNDEMAIKAAVKTCNETDPSNTRTVLIKNSLSMEEIYLSRAYLEHMKDISGLTMESGCRPLPFDANGNLILWNH